MVLLHYKLSDCIALSRAKNYMITWKEYFNYHSNYKCDFICILFLTQNQDLILSQIFSMNYTQRLFHQRQLAWYVKRQGKEDKEAPSMVNYQKPGSCADQHGLPFKSRTVPPVMSFSRKLPIAMCWKHYRAVSYLIRFQSEAIFELEWKLGATCTLLKVNCASLVFHLCAICTISMLSLVINVS